LAKEKKGQIKCWQTSENSEQASNWIYKPEAVFICFNYYNPGLPKQI